MDKIYKKVRIWINTCYRSKCYRLLPLRITHASDFLTYSAVQVAVFPPPSPSPPLDMSPCPGHTCAAGPVTARSMCVRPACSALLAAHCPISVLTGRCRRRRACPWIGRDPGAVLMAMRRHGMNDELQRSVTKWRRWFGIYPEDFARCSFWELQCLVLVSEGLLECDRVTSLMFLSS